MAIAGWYNDENDPTLARWHDGVGWTDDVLVKADWEGLPEGPPPPDELWAPEPAGPRQLRVAVAAAVLLAVLVGGGVALAHNGDDGGPASTPTERRTGTVADAGTTGGTSDLTVDVTSAGSGLDSLGVDDDLTPGTDPSTARRGTARTTPATAKAPTVQHTDTATHTQTNNRPVTETGKGDQESIGHTNNTSITNGYTPPPTTTTTEGPSTSTSTTVIGDTTGG